LDVRLHGVAGDFADRPHFRQGMVVQATRAMGDLAHREQRMQPKRDNAQDEDRRRHQGLRLDPEIVEAAKHVPRFPDQR
jgi:hypothetical protein